ncbi:AraC family transcriptional regulator [Spirosoma endbachense]|uniref:Helix-turn-helix domain-containing protein n=1 Tax=Spirosoma endbachense TaxID=2666025 RepID=A0A6P1VVC6_9BACT|nr:helix-turn-helix domain-containing protein [Spirosoma endbachense]QHV95326.1 helix-turn-helix domain-containing protein [Spirosoma endbachense]
MQHITNINHFYPCHPLLRQYIEYYYFLRTDSPDFVSQYYVFPNTLQSLNIHKHAYCWIEETAISVSSNQQAPPLLIAQGRYERPLFVELRGISDKLTIVFKPLGLNHFITKPLIEITPNASQLFTDWDQYLNHQAFIHSFFSTSNLEQRIRLLETYLVAIYHPIPHENSLTYALDRLTDFGNEPTIRTIIDELSMNVRTFNRLFIKNIGLSPASYRRVARFRHSLRDQVLHEHFKNLTQTGYDSNFYDQAYFVKTYRQFTGHNPKKLLQTISRLASNQLLMKVIH